MAAIGVELVTMSDVAKSKNKQIGKVAEVLLQSNPILNDIPYIEMNEKTIHTESLRSNLPTVYYRKANQPIPASKTNIEERNFSAAHFESKSQMDIKVAARGGADRVPFNRWNQAQGHIQAMANEHADLMIYGSPASDARKVSGFMDILSTLSASEPTSKQIISAGGVGSDNTSILFVDWGEQTIFGVYPSGCEAGLKRTDRGQVQIVGTTESGSTGTFWGWEEDFEIDHGLVIKDYRAVARVCNIDISDLKDGGVTAADLLKLMTRAHYRIPAAVRTGKGVVYMNSTIASFLHEQSLEKVGAGGGLTFQNYQGEQVMMFLGRRVVVTDALLNTEAVVS
jgi:hypothetical protein